MKRLFLLLCIIVFFVCVSPVNADEGWIIDNFQSNITIAQTGKVEVVETIDADFGNLVKHGIYRDIPNIYYDENNNNTYADIHIASVLKNGVSEQYQQSQNGNFLRLQIGNPNRTFSGKVEYKITYSATGVLRSFSDHDELYWDVTGNGWPVAIRKTQATVTLPTNGITGTRCWVGQQGSTETCTTTTTSQQQTTFSSNRILQSGENMTALLGYTKGMVPILTVSKPQSADTNISDTLVTFNVIGFLGFSIFGIGSALFLFFKHGRDQKGTVPDTIVAQYQAPDKLRPAEVGTILDERADTLDVSATIVDLAVRGFLTITEQEKKWLFGSTDYVLSKNKKSTDGLLPYEKLLLERIFVDGDSIKISELERNFYTDLALVKASLYSDVIDKKHFDKNPESVKQKYAGFGLAFLIIGFVLCFVLFPLLGVWIGLILAGLAFLIVSPFMPHRTALGHQTYEKILGFKLFMDKAENYRQQFFEKENIFNELLPYAMVFGNTEKFAKAFQDMGLKPPQPTWYVSSQPFNAYLFTTNMNSFSRSLTSAIASQPQRNSFASGGSGFSSGGGFSGGGFGGGGGGSW